ncbi:spore cortex-lytic enzyme [Bacillus aquiflavi]|uniref:Spore cortex-lytic enzyme n=1 Tax=Bacillus aquiflavi TaxID=2672567 RepID=A0A6B3VX91_9BACI|nr:spore cortex-lytic enzyme [Bacillus aquiflavi]MBA4537345.1 spore cortex-lytic enzyme [Bacillus aquiflavi]NEY81602.1 spore cortex-lytic enzyme [Bacillus aquiflavi]
MKLKKHWLKLAVIISLCIVIIPLNSDDHAHRVNAFTNQVIQQGAVGEDVIELQARLQYLGFYNGNIDGVFGWGTYWALRNFQYEFGLPIDGLAGHETKEKLKNASKYNKSYVHNQINKGKKFTHYGGVNLQKQTGPQKTEPSKKPTTERKPSAGKEGGGAKPQTAPTTPKPTATNTPNGFSQNDLRLLANAVHGEARGEPYVGQVAVAAVILNRLNSSTFPNTVSGVIFEPGAFTAVADGQIWLTPNETSQKAVLDAINGWDPTGYALYYFNPDTATSPWIWTRPQIKKIGKHIFCK